MILAQGLARRGLGRTSPNPVVGAVLVKRGRIIGRGWHRQAGAPHAEVEAICDAARRGYSAKGATLYVTLEPCCTRGRTPPCTEAIQSAGIRRVVVGATDPNPRHAGRAFAILDQAGVLVTSGVLQGQCSALNESFNHWIVHRTPWVTVKAAMTMDGKIATKTGESKWITGERSRAYAMKLRQVHDAILVGVNTVLMDDPSLTVRNAKSDVRNLNTHHLRRIILDSMARTPLTAKVVADEHAALTTIVVSHRAPRNRVSALKKLVNVLVAPPSSFASQVPGINPRWLLNRLGRQGVTSLLVEGGGEVHGSFLVGGVAHKVAFFYAPIILGGRESRKAVAGVGIGRLKNIIELHEVNWRRLGQDLLLTARIRSRGWTLRRDRQVSSLD